MSAGWGIASLKSQVSSRMGGQFTPAAFVTTQMLEALMGRNCCTT